MGDVVDIRARLRVKDAIDGGMLTGPAKCLRCWHLWDATTRTGNVDELECPHCHALAGIMMRLTRPPDRELIRTCGCGNQLFYVGMQSIWCLSCGRAESKP